MCVHACECPCVSVYIMCVWLTHSMSTNCIVMFLCPCIQQGLSGARSGGTAEGITRHPHISVHCGLWKHSDWQVSHKTLSQDTLLSLSIVASVNALADWVNTLADWLSHLTMFVNRCIWRLKLVYRSLSLSLSKNNKQTNEKYIHSETIDMWVGWGGGIKCNLKKTFLSFLFQLHFHLVSKISMCNTAFMHLM